MKSKLCPRLKCLLIFSLMIMSCGKKAQNSVASSNQGQERSTPPVTTDVDEYLAKQQILCAEGEVCPNYIVKIVAFDKKVPKVCSGFLVYQKDADVVVTSTSCLPPLLRLKNQDCSDDVTIFFPQSNNQPAERVKCDRVVQFSEIDDKDAVLWHDDVAFLKLPKKMEARRYLNFKRDGFEHKQDYWFWGLEHMDEGISFIRRQTCTAIHHSYINPLASKATSPNMLFAGCDFKKLGTGSPIMDSRGWVRGVVSQPLDPRVRAYLESTGLLTQPLRSMLHGTSFACAPTIYDTWVQDEAECLKVLDARTLDRMRSQMMNRQDLYETKRAELQSAVSENSRFLNFDVTLTTDGDFKRAQITPKCFKNILKWIYVINTSRGNYSYETSFPQVSIKRNLSAEGHVGATVVDGGELKVFLQFSGKDLKKTRISDVLVWNDTFNQTYPKIGECR